MRHDGILHDAPRAPVRVYPAIPFREISFHGYPVCADGTDMCGDPHMRGLVGQRIDWVGENGGWYCLLKDDMLNFQVNIRVTAPLSVEFPDRQLITGAAILSGENSLVIEVKDPYTHVAGGCPSDVSPCLAEGGLRTTVNGQEPRALLGPVSGEYVADGIQVSASNLPVECQQFGGDEIWAEMHTEFLRGSRQLGAETFEEWVLSYDHMAAPEWCTKYIAERGLANVQSSYSLFQIGTESIDVRLHVGIGHQTGGETDWAGRILPDLDFWQMDIGLAGVNADHPDLSGMLGGTARPVIDDEGQPIMTGSSAFRGTVEDYRVSDAFGTDFALLHWDV